MKPSNIHTNPALTFCFAILLFAGCNASEKDHTSIYPPGNAEQVTITQGIWGNVWFWEGDFMPGGPPKGKVTPVKRDIFVYTATKIDSLVSWDGVFFREISSPLIGTVRSSGLGFFQIQLPPGKYSFFVKEDSLYYANGTDGDGHILSATVSPNFVTKRQIDITYRASY